MKPSELVANITAQLYSVTSRKDGGGRIQFEFGLESLDAIHKVQKWNAQGGANFTVVVVPTDMLGAEGLPALNASDSDDDPDSQFF